MAVDHNRGVGERASWCLQGDDHLDALPFFGDGSPLPRRVQGKTRVFLACTGLGHINRGYESFSRECFEALVGDDRLDLELYKGYGPQADRERAVWCLRRGGWPNRWLGSTVRRDDYYVENASFVLGLLPRLIARRPQVVYFSDVHIGNFLWHWRRVVGGRFRLLASNGGPIGPPDFPRFDHVHQVLRTHFEESERAGRAPTTQTLIPYGFRIDSRFRPLDAGARAALRGCLGLPVDRPVVLTVGAINDSHKRMSYVVREVAALPEPRPFLVMLGQREVETPVVLATADEAIGSHNYLCRTVPADQVQDYYDAADVFALGSLAEGYGRVLAEALARGLPCLANDRPFAREVLGPEGYFADLALTGGLAGLLMNVLSSGTRPEMAVSRHASAYDRLSWDRLGPSYVDMIIRCAAEPMLRDRDGLRSRTSPG